MVSYKGTLIDVFGIVERQASILPTLVKGGHGMILAGAMAGQTGKGDQMRRGFR